MAERIEAYHCPCVHESVELCGSQGCAEKYFKIQFVQTAETRYVIARKSATQTDLLLRLLYVQLHFTL